jgi:hypothetical protein
VKQFLAQSTENCQNVFSFSYLCGPLCALWPILLKEQKGRFKMERFNDSRITLLVWAFVLALVLTAGSANADFTFGEPVNLRPPINTEYDDDSPFISADGLSLYFTRGPSDPQLWDYDIWVATRATTADPWSGPVNLGPTINTPHIEWHPSVTADGLELYFDSDRPGGQGGWDLWVAKRKSADDDWGTPVNLGLTINSPVIVESSSVSPDGLTLMWAALDQPGGYGWLDTWMSRRTTRDDSWAEPLNLGPTINTDGIEANAVISPDSLVLFFTHQPLQDELGRFDLWMSRRSNPNAEWQTPVKLGPPLNTPNSEYCPSISSDGKTLYFADWPFSRPGGQGAEDIWQAPIIPICDFNADGIVDAADVCIMIDHWGENYPLCDIGPFAWGDGVVDVQDLIVLAEHLFEETPPAQ